MYEKRDSKSFPHGNFLYLSIARHAKYEQFRFSIEIIVGDISD
jgi:hypothetical protein